VRCTNLLIAFGMRKNCPRNRRNLLLYLYLNFTCCFDDFVEIDEYVLPCGLISIDELCEESSEVKDTNETSEESVPMPMHCEAVKAVETLQQFLQSMSDVTESVMKSVWEMDAFIMGLAQKRTKQMTLDSYFKKHCTDS
jgi:hypothetical protein